MAFFRHGLASIPLGRIKFLKNPAAHYIVLGTFGIWNAVIYVGFFSCNHTALCTFSVARVRFLVAQGIKSGKDLNL